MPHSLVADHPNSCEEGRDTGKKDSTFRLSNVVVEVRRGHVVGLKSGAVATTTTARTGTAMARAEAATAAAAGKGAAMVTKTGTGAEVAARM